MLKKNIFSWFYYHMPEKIFKQGSYKIQDYPIAKLLANDFSDLNNQRIEISKQIYKIGTTTKICSQCGGRCCQGNYDKYTVVDYILRYKSDNPISSFEKVAKPTPLAKLILNGAKSIFKRNHGALIKYKPKRKPCFYFIPNIGCSLPPEDRAIFCFLWTCRAFRDTLKIEDFIQLGHLLKALSSLGLEVARQGKGICYKRS